MTDRSFARIVWTISLIGALVSLAILLTGCAGRRSYSSTDHKTDQSTWDHVYVEGVGWAWCSVGRDRLGNPDGSTVCRPER